MTMVRIYGCTAVIPLLNLHDRWPSDRSKRRELIGRVLQAMPPELVSFTYTAKDKSLQVEVLLLKDIDIQAYVDDLQAKAHALAEDIGGPYREAPAEGVPV